MDIRSIESGDRQAMIRFLEHISAGDRTFFKHDMSDPDVLDSWLRPGGTRAIALQGGAIVGYVEVEPLHGWSSHVGEVRVVVDPDHRGAGIGRALARRAVLMSLDLGLTKMVVEVTADQEPTIAMFGSLGFDPEALLRDHVRDDSGQLYDLLVLAHSVEQSYAAMAAAGLIDAI